MRVFLCIAFTQCLIIDVYVQAFKKVSLLLTLIRAGLRAGGRSGDRPMAPEKKGRRTVME